MSVKGVIRLLPSWQNALLAVLSAVLLILAFPPFEWWLTAWFALGPLLWAVEREKGSIPRSFMLGWLFGNIFFFGTCWWLTFAPITYAGFPSPLAYLLLFCVSSAAAVFTGIFAAVLGFRFGRIGMIALNSAPLIWVFSEFLRYWLTGNSWNALGYSQAFAFLPLKDFATYGGIYLVGFIVACVNVGIFFLFATLHSHGVEKRVYAFLIGGFAFLVTIYWVTLSVFPSEPQGLERRPGPVVVATQPNIPMSGLNVEKWRELRQRHVRLAETALKKFRKEQPENDDQPTTVIFPESPMNFMYEDEAETKEFINSFAAKHNVSVLFNSAEPDASNGKYFNSAVLVGPEGREIAQYDKIYLLPFGEAVPFPLEAVMPAFVGSFSHGKEYDLLPLGDAKAGVMICFESHFGQLSREYVRNGADVIIEMTNDGYLGPTPVLRQHLANAVFRAVETNRPVLRVTNVGITGYINERGEVRDAAESYVEDTRVWTVARSDGSQTFYVKYGDWFAWLCTLVTIGMIGYAVMRRPRRVN